MSGTASSVVAMTAEDVGYTATGPIVLTEDNSGQTISLHVGQSVDVQLPGGASGGYRQPTSTSTVLARVAATGGYPTDQPARARFVATCRGTAYLTSTTDFTCLHTRPACLSPQREWLVHVAVGG